MSKIKQFVEENFEMLNLYTTAITRAHGKSHPETFQVRNLFEALQRKLENIENEIPAIAVELNELRTVTNNYKIPEDVCETYAKTYQMLSTFDQLYHAL